MAIVRLGSGSFSLVAYGKLGRPSGLGEHVCGVSLLGDYFPESGIYCRRKGRVGRLVVRCRHYVPTNPRTTAQQARRSAFAAGVSAWHELKDVDRQGWKNEGRLLRLNGFQTFMSAWMKGGV